MSDNVFFDTNALVYVYDHLRIAGHHANLKGLGYVE